VGLDTEGTGLDPRADRVRLLQLAPSSCEGTVYLLDLFALDQSALAILWEALAKAELVTHNGAFDLQFLAGLGFEPGTVRDTMLLSLLLHGPRKGKGFHSLGQVVARELGQALDKAEQTSDWSAPELTAAQLAYAATDAAVLLSLHRELWRKVDASGQAAVAALEQGALPAVAWMGAAGVCFDQDAWDALAAEAQAEALDLVRRLDAEAPDRPGCLIRDGAWNWSSPEQVQEAFALLGVPLNGTKAEDLAGVDHPLAALLRRHRSACKRASTYGPSWYARAFVGGRIFASWKQLGADSGRMACAGPNLQNLPRDERYRRCFVAPPGRLLVAADYSQIELRIAAKLTGDAALLDAYRRGADLHTLTAQKVLGKAEVTKEDRKLAKALNFGLLYGMGASRFRIYARTQYGLDLTDAQAASYRDAFFDAYPGLRAWHRRTGRSGKGAIETRTLAGRRRCGVQRFTEKLNTPVQGTGADGLKRAMALLWQRRTECPDVRLVLAVHDELVLECDEGQADRAAAWLKQAMLDGMTPLIDPVPVEVAVRRGRTWAGD
jgi:DNA polymerase-1